MSQPDATRAAVNRRIECPLCGSAEWHPSRRLSELLIRRCDRCYLSYRVDPIHTLNTLARTPAELAAIDASKMRLFERLIPKLGTPRPHDLLVDIGASSGYFVEVAGKAGWKAVGVELGRSLAQTARDLGRCVTVGNAEFLPIRTGTASVVTFCDVLDEFDRPGVAIAEAARVLRAGGTLAVRVRHGVVHELMRSQQWLPTKLSLLPNNLYSPKCLRKALADAGFEDVRVVVSPTTSGDPYASMKGAGARGLRLVKAIWNYAALLVALVSAETFVISPSIDAFGTRTGSVADRHE